jgi:uncharacterized protein YwgA
MLEASTFEPDLSKIKDLVHYVCYRKRDRPRQLSKTKLHKILFYSDLTAFLQLRRPISGERYIKHQYGPFSSHLQDAVAELEEESKVVVSENAYEVGGEPRTQNVYFAILRPSVSRFSAEEILIVDEVIERISPHTSETVSRVSHDVIWETRTIGEPIPYHSAFLYALGEVRPADLAWARNELEGWRPHDS